MFSLCPSFIIWYTFNAITIPGQYSYSKSTHMALFHHLAGVIEARSRSLRGWLVPTSPNMKTLTNKAHLDKYVWEYFIGMFEMTMGSHLPFARKTYANQKQIKTMMNRIDITQLSSCPDTGSAEYYCWPHTWYLCR